MEWYTEAGQLEGDPATPQHRGLLVPRAARRGGEVAADLAAACRAAMQAAACAYPQYRTGIMQHRPLLLKLLSAAIVFGAWEIAGRIPVSLRLPDIPGIDGGARPA